MNSVSRSRGLLARDDVTKLVQLCGSQLWRIDNLVGVASFQLNCSSVVCKNTVLFLTEIGFLAYDEKDNYYAKETVKETYQIEDSLRDLVLNSFLKLFEAEIKPTSFKFDPTDKRLLINRLLVPGRDMDYPYALLEFRIFERVTTEDKHWRISSDSERRFQELLRSQNRHNSKKMLTLEGLKKKLLQQEVAGQIAEEWVVEYEKSRLDGHPLGELIEKISDTDVTAGFDIRSFDSLESAVPSRHIEVKSYHGELEFHWSENEIDAAKRLGTSYWIYLVDRSELGDANYKPIQICDPWSYFFRRKPVGWSSSPTSFKFTKSLDGS